MLLDGVSYDTKSPALNRAGGIGVGRLNPGRWPAVADPGRARHGAFWGEHRKRKKSGAKVKVRLLLCNKLNELPVSGMVYEQFGV